MQAIILAAGMGKRLGELTQNNTKCMVKVNGITLIDRLMTQLSELSLKKIIIVIGYQGEKLRSYLGDNYLNTKIEYIYNPIYDKTNNIYSLALAKESLQEDDSLLIESDLIFDNSLFRKIIDNPYPDIALVDKYESWMDGTMVTLDEENNIENFVSKKAFKYSDAHNYYKTVNIYKFSKEFSKHKYVPFLDAYCKALGHNEYYEQVLKVISRLDDTHLKALPLNGEKWYEIDDIQDLDIAETIFATKKDQLIKYQSRYGGYWRFPSLLDFCYLVNPYFPPKKMKEELKANFDILLTEYPSGMKINSLLAGKYFGIKSDYVCIGNGAAELIKSLIEKLHGKIGVIFPTFEEYPNRKKQEELVTYIPDNRDFSYTAKDIMNYFAEKDIQTLLLINPDNPSGNFVPMKEVLELAEWTKKKNIRFIVDESFVDFSEGYPNNSLLHNKTLDDYNHLVVIKSISKSYGVPGLRLGILASSDKALSAWIKKDISIWNINSFAEFYMQIFGKYEQDYSNACSKFIAERKRFLSELQQIDFLRIIPSQANYFLCEIIKQYTSRELTRLLLKHYNILIKDCSTKSAFNSSNYIRIAIRDTNDNNALVNALKELQAI